MGRSESQTQDTLPTKEGTKLRSDVTQAFTKATCFTAGSYAGVCVLRVGVCFGCFIIPSSILILSRCRAALVVVLSLPERS